MWKYRGMSYNIVIDDVEIPHSKERMQESMDEFGEDEWEAYATTVNPLYTATKSLQYRVWFKKWVVDDDNA